MKNLGYFNQKHLGLLFVAMVLVGFIGFNGGHQKLERLVLNGQVRAPQKPTGL